MGNFNVLRTNVSNLHNIAVNNGLGRECNGVIRTDTWLDTDFNNPENICGKLLEYFQGGEDPQAVYKYLLNFGMYKPNRKSRAAFSQLKSQKLWEKVRSFYRKYKQKWSGPDIPIFIFPMDESNKQLLREGKGKSGVSFIDKMFLFLTPIDDEKEVEALFVHEYHHVCRMQAQKKSPDDYTLLDSMILEGLAEHAVAENCGEKYAGDWSRRYSTEILAEFWKKDLSKKLSIKRDDAQHDQILFGLRGMPRLLGYSMGYEIVKQYKEHRSFTEKTSFSVPSREFTKQLKF